MATVSEKKNRDILHFCQLHENSATGYDSLASGHQLSEVAKYSHLRGLAGQELRNEQTHIYASSELACFSSGGSRRAVLHCADRTSDFPAPYPYPARRLVWSLLRASSDHSFTLGALRAQRPCQLLRTLLPSSLVLSQGWGLNDLLLRAFNEGLLRPRVARARKIIRLHPSYLCQLIQGSGWPIVRDASPARRWLRR